MALMAPADDARIRLVDLTLPSPEENLACDEALLALCEEQHAPGILRFWEPAEPFVVVGYSNAVAAEVHLDRCRQEGIPVLRRFSGGGTVVQGPGCLDYALVLPLDRHSALTTIAGANRLVMETLRSAIASRVPGAAVRIEGSTDMTVNGKKVAGNAQRRGVSHLLFHGVFLLTFDLQLLDRLLPLPSRQPDYRRSRPHQEFVRNLPLTPAAVRQALADAWHAGPLMTPLELPMARIKDLTAARYCLPSWNFRR